MIFCGLHHLKASIAPVVKAFLVTKMKYPSTKLASWTLDTWPRASARLVSTARCTIELSSDTLDFKMAILIALSRIVPSKVMGFAVADQMKVFIGLNGSIPMSVVIGHRLLGWGDGELSSAFCTYSSMSGHPLVCIPHLEKTDLKDCKSPLPSCSTVPSIHGQYCSLKWCGIFRQLRIRRAVSIRKCTEPSYMMRPLRTPNAADQSTMARAAFSVALSGIAKNRL